MGNDTCLPLHNLLDEVGLMNCAICTLTWSLHIKLYLALQMSALTSLLSTIIPLQDETRIK